MAPTSPSPKERSKGRVPKHDSSRPRHGRHFVSVGTKLTGGILVPAAQRHVMHRREMKHMGAKIIMGDLGLAYRTITVLDQYTEMEV